VQRGRVRIHSRVVERPVEESVRLRDETVTVERRPVDRPATAAEIYMPFYIRKNEDSSPLPCSLVKFAILVFSCMAILRFCTSVSTVKYLISRLFP
jgi:Domain of unknown function (DUF2382)